MSALPLVIASSGLGGANLVLDMLVILGAAAVISVLLRRLHIASIPGYLIIGTIIGSLPESMRLIQDTGNIAQIQEIAIILLMFTIGLHLDLDSIKTGMTPILVVGAVSTVAVSLALWPLCMLFGLSAPAGLAVAMALSMSSTAVLLGILQKEREVHLIQGRLCIGISIMQDLLSIGVLAAMPLLGVWAGIRPDETMQSDGSPAWLKMVSAASLGVGGILAMLGFARYLLPKLLREAAWGGNTEGLLVASAGAGLSAAMLTGFLGFGPALGAFLAGFMLSNTPFRSQLTGQLGPMRDLFMAVFFTAVGANLDVMKAMQYWWIILLALPLLVGIKMAVVGVTIWAGGATAAAALLSSALLAQAGEFSLVVLAEAERRGLVGDSTKGVIIPLVVISLVLTSWLYEQAKRNTPRVANIKPAGWLANPTLREQPAPHAHEANVGEPGSEGGARGHARHVIIAGFGIVGRNLAEHFAAGAITFTIVDLNAETIVKQRKLGRRTIYGDITNPDVLESAGIHTAEAVVLTVPDDDASLRACKAIREIRPDVYIAVRTSFLSRAIAAHELGADHVTIEEVATAQDMAVKVMLELNKRFGVKKDEMPHL